MATPLHTELGQERSRLQLQLSQRFAEERNLAGHYLSHLFIL